MPLQQPALSVQVSLFWMQNDPPLEQTLFEQNFEQQSAWVVHALPDVLQATPPFVPTLPAPSAVEFPAPCASPAPGPPMPSTLDEPQATAYRLQPNVAIAPNVRSFLTMRSSRRRSRRRPW